jgi:tetratricopeptide (TPR) repeat protein
LTILVPSLSGHYGSIQIFRLLSLLLAYCGRLEEAELAAQRALRLSPYDPLSAIYFCIASVAQFAKRNYKEAMRLARESIRQRPDFAAVHRVLTAAAGMAGEKEVAKAALQELRRAQPNISLEWVAKQIPIKHDTGREHYMEGLRRAGLD